ncbi:MAG: PepSY-associated TM helix domain-containing protein, partial [Pseudomonadota bacterium]
MTQLQFFMLARTIHLYSSTALFASLAFFCATGITLSHGWYLDDASSSGSVYADVPGDLADTLTPDDWDPDLDALQTFVEASVGLTSPQNIELDPDYGEIILSYNAPGGDAEVIVTADGLEVDVQRGSWLAVLNNLHKNRDAGAVWAFLVDATAVGMLLFALTGLVIVFQNRRKRARSLWVIALG